MQGSSFIEAGSLLVGDKLVNVNNEDLIIEDYHIKLTDELLMNLRGKGKFNG